MDKNNKKRILFAVACFVVASITAAILIKSTFFRVPTEFSLALLPIPFYFTTQTNIFAMVWLFYIGLAELMPRLPKPKPILGLMVSCYISVTCIAYWLVLVPMLKFVPALFSPENIWLHTVTSIFTPAMFFGFTKGEKISRRVMPIILIYPVCYIVFAYIVHAFTGKYVYPFLNPQAMGNYYIFVMVLVMIAALLVAIGFAYRYVWNKKVAVNYEEQSNFSV